MIPDFTPSGLLPPGIHVTSWEEFAGRFCVFKRSDQRLRIGARLQNLFDECRRSGIVIRFVVAGSFVTAKDEPNDFDSIVILDASILDQPLPPFQYNLVSKKMAQKMFKGDVFPVFDNSNSISDVFEFFQTTRDGKKIGIVEIQLW